MQETHGQYWRNGMYVLICYWISNPFHCRHKELIIFIIAYFLLHCPPYSVLRITNLEVATSKNKQNPLKVAGYKPANVVKLNSSRVIFKDF